MTDTPTYLALDSQGYEYRREAKTVNELVHKDRRPALNKIAEILGVSRVRFGISIYNDMRYTKKDIEQHGDLRLFRLPGAEMPLSLLHAPNTEGELSR